MAVNTVAFFLQNPLHESGAGIASGSGPGGMYPEGIPAILWGIGTPDGDRSPFLEVNKGSLYIQVDATDDSSHNWVKVDEGADNDDWVLLVQNAGVPTGVRLTRSALYDISVTDSEQELLTAEAALGALTILRAYLVLAEATGASGAAEGDITIGSATGGNEIVAATAYAANKAIGTHQDLTLKNGAVAAAGTVFASHDIAAGAVGTYKLFLEWAYD